MRAQALNNRGAQKNAEIKGQVIDLGCACLDGPNVDIRPPSTGRLGGRARRQNEADDFIYPVCNGFQTIQAIPENGTNGVYERNLHLARGLARRLRSYFPTWNVWWTIVKYLHPPPFSPRPASPPLQPTVCRSPASKFTCDRLLTGGLFSKLTGFRQPNLPIRGASKEANPAININRGSSMRWNAFIPITRRTLEPPAISHKSTRSTRTAPAKISEVANQSLSPPGERSD